MKLNDIQKIRKHMHENEIIVILLVKENNIKILRVENHLLDNIIREGQEVQEVQTFSNTPKAEELKRNYFG